MPKFTETEHHTFPFAYLWSLMSADLQGRETTHTLDPFAARGLVLGFCPAAESFGQNCMC
jgi:hypothetical protein